MNNFKQFVILTSLASFISYNVQGMEKSTFQEKIESDDIFELLKNNPKDTEQIQTNYLFAGDEATRRSKWDIALALVKEEKATTQYEETARKKRAAKKSTSLNEKMQPKTRTRSLSTGLYVISEDVKPRPKKKLNKKTSIQKQPLNTIQE